jgi:hypothetical protein
MGNPEECPTANSQQPERSGDRLERSESNDRRENGREFPTDEGKEALEPFLSN